MGAYRGVAWSLTGVWGALGLGAALALNAAAEWQLPLGYLGTIVACGALVGLACGHAIAAMARSAGGLLAGALLGHIVLAPPAVQLGQWAATAAVQVLPALDPRLALLALPAYAVVFTGVAVALLCAGSAVGIGFHALLRSPLRKAFPEFAPGSWRPRWRTVRIAVLLAVLAGALVYADRKVGVPWPEATPPSASSWIEREIALFREVLGTQKYEVLVLPVQAEEPSFDRIARSLMTRYLAQRAEERTGARMPDPTLVARAFGARSRSLEREDALRFAATLGARKVVVSRVKRAGQAFQVRAELWTRDSEQAAWRETAAGALDNLAYHDRLPPSVGFRDAVDALLDQLKLGEPRPVSREVQPELAAQPIDDLLQLASLDGGSALERAQRLQVLASLHDREGIEAETLWERSLVALWRAGGGSELERVLEARAWLHLSRRPYALERLGAPASAAARALAAALNGNVPQLEAAAAAIEQRELRLLAEIELADLYDAYGLHKRLIARRKQLLEPAWTEAAALAFRLSAPDWFASEAHVQAAEAVRPVAPLEFDWTEIASMWLRWLYWRSDPIGLHELRLARLVERGFAPAWKAKAADWAPRRASDRPAPWDYYDLMFALNREALLKSVYGTLHLQGLPREAAAMIDGLGALYQGYPRLMYFKAWALDRMGRDALPGPQKRRFSRSSALALSAYQWEGGETHLSSAVEYYIYERNYRKYLDEPPRRYRTQVPRERLQFERTAFGSQEMERYIADARRRLEYADRHARPLQDLVRWLRRAGRPQEALAAIEAHRHRFVGTLARAELLAEARESAQRGEDPLPAYRELLEMDPDSWDARWRLARAYLEGGRAREAQQTLLEFPGFADPEGHHIVGLSNRAFEAGEYLYRRGEPQLATALFAQSTRLRTWSAREIHSRELLAVIDNDLEGALKQARYQLERYSDGQAAMRVVLYDALLGRRDQAWSAFTAFANRFDHRPWPAAFVAHRMQEVEGRALEEWLAREKARDTTRDYLSNALRERHAFMLALVDREPAEEALALVGRAARANNNSPFYPQLAEGYIAFRKADYATAAAKLSGPHRDLHNISINRRESLSEWLPHVVLAHARSGQRVAAEKLLAEHLGNIGVDSDYLVARALVEGSAGRHDEAAASLRLAFHRLPRPSTRSFPPGYTLLEAAEMLLAESGNETYRALIEDLARRLQIELPYAWAAAFEAKYARDLDTRQLALAAAAILDPKSERIAHFSEAEREAVRPAAVRHGSLLGTALRAPQR